jgi:hypothetical protein
LCFIIAYCDGAHATDVRGRIDFSARNGIFPMNGAFVELCIIVGGCLSYRTGYDGMYYFRAAPGNHQILVNGRLLLRKFIPNQPYFDIPPLIGN